MTRIMIDGRNLGLEKGTGVATYARNLSHELHAMGHGVEVLYGYGAGPSRNALMREIAFFDANHGDRDRIAAAIEAVRSRLIGPFGQHAFDVPISGRVVSRTFSARLPYFDRIVNSPHVFARSHATFGTWKMLTRLSMADRPDIAHWTYPLPIRLKGRPNVYTMHDVVPLKLPYTTLDNKRFYLRLMKRIARVADHIITVSECSKRDLIDLVGIPEHRITNTYQSVDIPEKFLAKSDEEVAREVEGTVGVDYKGYYLFWGSIEPKKNIGRMIEGYLASKVTAPLVIVGAMAWKSDEELRLLNDENIVFRRTIENDEFTRKRVMILPYAPFSLLVSLIRGARATLFPSIYEGFGLPVLEAMLLGTPVISSNTASLPEVAGDAALLVDPYDTSAIARALRTIDGDEALRADMAARGRVQAAKFSRTAYRERLAQVYRAVS
ncbi:glycosyltransferase family 1 protein [Novosphingobium sp.]|uniref:glycosyltransferase family 4 protein n=1 Tax=Novosphingobium sp. TaxID=1874826 RepID=UPI003340EEEE